jgi:hypothetical protein
VGGGRKLRPALICVELRSQEVHLAFIEQLLSCSFTPLPPSHPSSSSSSSPSSPVSYRRAPLSPVVWRLPDSALSPDAATRRAVIYAVEFRE